MRYILDRPITNLPFDKEVQQGRGTRTILLENIIRTKYNLIVSPSGIVLLEPDALWIGIIWGFWHAPIILNGHNYPQHPVAGVFMMVAFCLLFTPMLMYFRQKSGSVIVPAIMHGTFNAVVGISAVVVTPANDLLYGGPGLAGFIVLLMMDVCLYLYDRYFSKERVFASLL